MLAAMAGAETGDEQRGEDPTTLALCAEVARMLGMEDAIFLPSGTMCNQIAFLVHCRPGDEILAAANSHIFRSEGAGLRRWLGRRSPRLTPKTASSRPRMWLIACVHRATALRCRG